MSAIYMSAAVYLGGAVSMEFEVDAAGKKKGSNQAPFYTNIQNSLFQTTESGRSFYGCFLHDEA